MIDEEKASIAISSWSNHKMTILPSRRSYSTNVCWNEQLLPFFGRLVLFKETNQYKLIVTRRCHRANHRLWRKGNRHPWFTRGVIFLDKLLTKISIIFYVLLQLLRGLLGAISLCFYLGWRQGSSLETMLSTLKALSKERLKSDLLIFEAQNRQEYQDLPACRPGLR